ncbi:hypothetical protein LJ753_13990 [Arthrobacter sp. zg-Y20]|uniref:hypothetical protein n=1 Tax=unclassified Arthrobacter TaxID=235627 RepID=UPI001D1383C7|nr:MULTISPECIES: hypothetical protein [unclassified Arthrobacter]MCC3276978.1 hypothetical protein [Arthrobacter sp. zg-Y20]MDK1317139.1 hypothetical protein [Arthrobacter sp. zg.Y20]WIB07237.1 hypothetical protein QNO06_05800 [Arthrobacter sp. zg-Y20]
MAIFNVSELEAMMPEPEEVRAAAKALLDGATAIDTITEAAAHSWGKLQSPEVYAIDGSEVVFSAYRPIKTASEDLAGDFGTLDGAANTYADEVVALKARLAAAKADAAAFNRKTAGDDDWNKDQDLYDEQLAITGELNSIAADLSTAERNFANALTAIYGGDKYVETSEEGPGAGEVEYGFSRDSLNTASMEGNVPWAHPREYDKPWYQDVGDAIGSFAKGVWSGVTGTITGLGNMVGLGGPEAFAQTWKGLGKLAMDVAIVAVPGVSMALVATGNGQKVKDAADELLAVGKAAIHWDEWKTDPAYAAGASAFDLASILMTAGAGASAKVGSVASKVSDVAGTASKVGKAVDVTGLGKAADVTIKVTDFAEKLKIDTSRIAAQAGRNLFDGGKTTLPRIGQALPDADPSTPPLRNLAAIGEGNGGGNTRTAVPEASGRSAGRTGLADGNGSGAAPRPAHAAAAPEPDVAPRNPAPGAHPAHDTSAPDAGSPAAPEASAPQAAAPAADGPGHGPDDSAARRSGAATAPDRDGSGPNAAPADPPQKPEGDGSGPAITQADPPGKPDPDKTPVHSDASDAADADVKERVPAYAGADSAAAEADRIPVRSSADTGSSTGDLGVDAAKPEHPQAPAAGTAHGGNIPEAAARVDGSGSGTPNGNTAVGGATGHGSSTDLTQGNRDATQAHTLPEAAGNRAPDTSAPSGRVDLDGSSSHTAPGEEIRSGTPVADPDVPAGRGPFDGDGGRDSGPSSADHTQPTVLHDAQGRPETVEYTVGDRRITHTVSTRNDQIAQLRRSLDPKTWTDADGLLRAHLSPEDFHRLDNLRNPDGTLPPKVAEAQVAELVEKVFGIEGRGDVPSGLSPLETALRGIPNRYYYDLTDAQAALVHDVRHMLGSGDSRQPFQKILSADEALKVREKTDRFPGSVGGFITQASDTVDLRTVDEIILGLRLDYSDGHGGIAFNAGEVDEIYAIRFNLAGNQANNVVIPDASNHARVDEIRRDRIGEADRRPAVGPLTERDTDLLRQDELDFRAHMNNGEGIEILGDSAVWPNTGHGLTSSRVEHLPVVPELKIEGGVALKDGSEMWRIDRNGREVLVGIYSKKLKQWISL